MNRQNTPQSDFKGFGDFVEIFRSGTHTDHAGTTQSWTNNDIDQIIANHSVADAAPIVIGHPAKDASSPAYGWTQELKRVGNTLLAKFADVEPQFEQMVKSGQFKNRSIRILKNANGLRLGHVGWLGATPPAISGLQPVEFAAADEVFDFSMAEWQSTGIMARMLRNMRDFLIAQFGQEKADAVLPNYDIDELNRLSEQQYQDEQAEQSAEASGNPLNDYSQPQDNGMDIPTQADLDAAKQQASDFAAQNQTLTQALAAEKAKTVRIECQAIVDKHLQRGVKPATLVGVVDFMLSLDSADAGTFEFSVGEGAKKQTSQREFVKGLLAQLPVAVKPGQIDFSGFDESTASDFSAPNGVVVDPERLALHDKAVAYQSQHNCDYATAVNAVARGK